jgi:uncharacterized membrane protein YkvA (DUF1232 family)
MAEEKKKKAKKKTANKKVANKKTVKKTVKKKSVKTKKTPAKKVDTKKAHSSIEKKAKKVSEKDLQDLIGREEEVIEKLKKVPGVFEKLVNRMRLLFEMLKDFWKGEYREVPWYTIAIAVAAVLYFINPFDIILDIIPGAGYLDDVVVIGFVYKAIHEDLKTYCKFKGYDTELFF